MSNHIILVEETENGATLLTSITHYEWEQARNEEKSTNLKTRLS